MKLFLQGLTIILFASVFILDLSCASKDSSPINREAQKIKKAGYTYCKVYSSDFAMNQLLEKGRLIMEFKYNLDGYVVEMVRYNLDGTVNHRMPVDPQDTTSNSFVKSGFAGQTIETVTMDSAGQAIQKTLISYNQNGNITERFVIKNKRDTISHNSYKYNEEGLITDDIYWDVELRAPVQVIRYEYYKP